MPLESAMPGKLVCAANSYFLKHIIFVICAASGEMSWIFVVNIRVNIIEI